MLQVLKENQEIQAPRYDIFLPFYLFFYGLCVFLTSYLQYTHIYNLTCFVLQGPRGIQGSIGTMGKAGKRVSKNFLS